MVAHVKQTKRFQINEISNVNRVYDKRLSESHNSALCIQLKVRRTSKVQSKMTDTRKSNVMSDGITNTRNLILRGMSAIYLIAFVSFYYQSAGKFL